MKALFNIKKLQVAKLTETNGVISYATPIQVAGTVSLTMNVEQSSEAVYADGTSYITVTGAIATTGTLENYFIPKEVLKQIYGYVESANHELMQTDKQPAEFAMQFACDDENGKEVYFTYYRVTSTKPGINLQTKESGTTINPQSVELNAIPITLADNSTRVIYSFATEDATNYATYFNSVSVPTLPTSI